MNYVIAQRGVDFIRGMWKKNAGENEGESGGEAERESEAARRVERELKDNDEILSLPSQGNASNGINILQIAEGGMPEIAKPR